MNDAPTLPGTRIAVVGAGAIGLAHIAVIRASQTSTLSAIVDPASGTAAIAAVAGDRQAG